MDGGPRGSCDPNAIGVVLETTLDAVSRRQEGVKPLNQVGMAGKELGDAADHARGINSALWSATLSAQHLNWAAKLTSGF